MTLKEKIGQILQGKLYKGLAIGAVVGGVGLAIGGPIYTWNNLNEPACLTEMEKLEYKLRKSCLDFGNDRTRNTIEKLLSEQKEKEEALSVYGKLISNPECLTVIEQYEAEVNMREDYHIYYSLCGSALFLVGVGSLYASALVSRINKCLEEKRKSSA